MNKCSLVRGNAKACLTCADYDDCPDSIEAVVPIIKNVEKEEKIEVKKIVKKPVKKGKGKK